MLEKSNFYTILKLNSFKKPRIIEGKTANTEFWYTFSDREYTKPQLKIRE